VSFHLTDDVASVVVDRLRMLVKNGWQGLVLVFLVMWLFFQVPRCATTSPASCRCSKASTA
jgi:multidrug efflux pump subunit AcrB